MKDLSAKVMLGIVMVMCVLVGCREENKPVEAPDALPVAGDTSPAPEDAFPAKDHASDPMVLAMIGDEPITIEDVHGALEHIPERRLRTSKYNVLDDFIQDRIFAEEARKAGLDEDPDIQREVKNTADETIARFFTRFHIERAAEPSEEVLREHYEKHEEQFVVPERVLLRHIVVKQKEEAEKLLAKIEAGESFEALAKDHSICRCWKTGGEHGWIPKDQLSPDMQEVALGATVGEINGVLETKAGFEIYRIQAKEEQKKIAFEEARAKIRRKLFLENKKTLMDQFYDKAGLNKHPDKEGVLLTVGGEDIPEEAIADVLAKVSEEERADLRARWVDYLADVKVFSSAAKEAGWEDDPALGKELRRTTDRVLADAFRKRFLSEKIALTDADLEAYYEAHIDQFTTPEMIRCKAILVKTKEEAENVLKALDGGAVFSKLAIEKSLHPLASRRAGEIGWFSRGEKDPALEEAAFSLAEGQVSDIIKTEEGYQIIQLIEKKGPQTRPLEEIKDLIRIRATKERQDQIKKEYYDKAGVKFLQWEKPVSQGKTPISTHAVPGLEMK